MENCVEPKMDEYLEIPVMESAVSSPCDQTHHGWSLGGMAEKSTETFFRYLGFSAHLLGFGFSFLARLTRLSEVWTRSTDKCIFSRANLNSLFPGGASKPHDFFLPRNTT
jgi:hypothetical protein